MASACGVSHMLKFMQRTTFQIYMNGEFAKSVAGDGSVAENGMEGRTGLRPGWFNQKTRSLKIYRSAEKHEDLCLSWGRTKHYVDIVINKETRVLAFRNKKDMRFSGRCNIANVRTSNRRSVGKMGATASVTNSTASEHGDNAPAPNNVDAPEPVQLARKQIKLLEGWKPPRYLWRSVACVILAGQVFLRIIQGKVHVRNSIQQLRIVGPESLGVSLLTASFVGMVFTIQFVREFARLGLTRSVGGVLALALSRELSPVVTAIILAGRVGSAFAAELGTMQVSEQTDTLRVLRTDPIDYLVTPRVIACCVSLPILTIICFSVAMGASVLLADSVYNVSSNIILESAARALQPWDLISTSIKSVVFGGIISIISCTWGVTTLGGAKGVGESTTSAVVISLVCIFIADFVLSWLFFQGAGDALKAAMG